MPRLRFVVRGLILFQLFSYYGLQGQYLIEEFKPKIKSIPNTAGHTVQDNGKIVMLGDYTFVGDSVVANLLRFHPNGQIDTDFVLSSELIQEFTTDFSRCCGRARVFNGVNNDLVLMADGTRRRVSIINDLGQFKTDIPTPEGYFQIERIIKHNDGYIAIVHKTGTQQSVFRLDQNGEIDSSFLQIDYEGYVDDIAVDSNNNILIVGDLTIDEVSRNLIRVSESGILDNSFGTPSLNLNFTEIDLFPDGKILISSITEMVLLDANANVIESFTPNVDGSNIYSSVVDPINNRIIILEEQHPSSVTIKALELDGSVSDSFNSISVDGLVNAVARILYHNEKFIMTIGFGEIEYNDVKQSFLAFDAFGNVLTDISTKEKLFTVGKVNAAVGLEEGSIVVGGEFSYIGNAPVNNLAKLDKAGNLDNEFNANNPLSNTDQVREIKISSENKLYVGGFFHDILETDENSLIRIGTDGVLDKTFITNKPSTASTEFLNDFIIMSDRIIACGAYSQDVVAFDFSGNEMPAFNNNIFGSQNVRVKSLSNIDEDNFAISGEVLNEKGFIWVMDINGDIDNSFVRQDDISIDSEHIVKVGNDLYRSGKIMGGQSSNDANFIYKYSLETGAIDSSNFSTYTISVNRHLLALNDSTVIISGQFDQFNDTEAHNFVASNFNGEPYERLVFDVSSGIDGYYLEKTVSVSDEEILLLGRFNSINNNPYYSIALLNNGNFSPEVNIDEFYSIPEDTSFYLSDIVEIIDLDDEVQINLEEHDNFSEEAGLITLQENFNGIIDLSFSVSDPFSTVGPFNIQIEITPVNDAPEIISQLEVPKILPGEQYEILLELLEVTDADSDELAITLNPGENYSIIEGNSILSSENFNGMLNVGVIVSDGTLNSEEFIFNIQSSFPLGLGNKLSVELYPNPSLNYVNIGSTENIEIISIYDINGHKLGEYSYTDLKKNQNIIQTGMWSPGLYIINIISKSQDRHQIRLIKK